MDKQKEIFVTILRRRGKRLTTIAKAMQLAKEGSKVTIFGIGGHIIIEPLSAKDALFQKKRKK